MILSTLADAGRYHALHPRFADAFRFLLDPATAKLSDGRHDIDGDELFAIVWTGVGKGRSAAVLEYHRQYIDIQYVVSGVDEIGWRPCGACQREKQPFDQESDLGFYADQPLSWCRVSSGSYLILFPEDAHAPLATTASIKKIVVKVKLD